MMKVFLLTGCALVCALFWGCNLSGIKKEPQMSKSGKKGKKTAKKTAKKSTSKSSNPLVRLNTSKGDIVVELDQENAPISTKNFLEYVNSGYYNNTIFHRVIPGFMVQCGGFEPGMKEKESGEPIKNEADNGLKNLRGTLAMARTQVVDSATAQFFINLNDNAFLDHGARDFGYAVFGKVVEGMENVDAIAKVSTGSKGYHDDVPTEDIMIITAEVVK